MSKTTSPKRGKANTPSANTGDATPPHPAPLDVLDDTPIAPPRAHDLVAALTADGLAISAEPKPLTTVSQYPNALRWSVELLARQANRSVEAAVAFLLVRGLPVLWIDVEEIRRARQHLLAHGTTDDRFWLDACPPVAISCADTGYKRFVVRIADSLRSEAGTLASTLGLPLSQIIILGMMAGLVNAGVVPPRYRRSLVESLRAFRKLIGRRAARAGTLVDATPVTHAARVEKGWTLEEDLWAHEDDDE